MPGQFGLGLVLLAIGVVGLAVGFFKKRGAQRNAESWIAGSAMVVLVGVAMTTTSGALG